MSTHDTPPTPPKTRGPRRLPAGSWPVPADAPEVDLEIAPGLTVKTRLPKAVPQYALMTIIQDADGKCRVGPVVWSQYLPMGRHIPSQLGVPIHYNTLRRLVLMGAVECSHPTPESLMLDAASLLRHLRRTRVRPGQPSWWTKERRELWRASAAGNTLYVVH